MDESLYNRLSNNTRGYSRLNCTRASTWLCNLPMKPTIDQKYVCQIGSLLQHKLACSLATVAGYESLRAMLADYYNVGPTSVYKQNLKTISMAEAANIINALKSGTLPPPPKGHRIKREGASCDGGVV